MCPKDVVNIHVPRKDDEDRLMGPSIIELEFEKGGKSIQLRMKRETPTFYT